MADAWLKTFRTGNRLSPHQRPDDLGPIGEERTFFEPLSTYSDGSPKLAKNGDPMGRPNYELGSLIATYWNGTHEVRDVWEVIGPPEPAERLGWGWQTPVRLIAKIEPGKPGVPLAELAVSTSSLMRRVRLRFDHDQKQRLEQAFAL